LRTRAFISAVILAAGASSRLGEFKQLIKLGRTMLLERIIRSVKSTKVNEVILILGYRADEIQRRLKLIGVRVVINHNYSEGMSSSLKTGLGAVSTEAKAALIILADQPFLSSGMIGKLLNEYRRSEALIVAPTYRGIQGNPVILDRKLFPEVFKISGDAGAKSIIKKYKSEFHGVEVKSFEELMDIDTVKDLKRALEHYRDH
jgi:molybdenum cofactor cytidylyltransferase